MKDVNNSKMVQASTEIELIASLNAYNERVCSKIVRHNKCVSVAGYDWNRPSDAQLEAADRIVNQLAGIIARVKGRA